MKRLTLILGAFLLLPAMAWSQGPSYRTEGYRRALENMGVRVDSVQTTSSSVDTVWFGNRAEFFTIYVNTADIGWKHALWWGANPCFGTAWRSFKYEGGPYDGQALIDTTTAFPIAAGEAQTFYTPVEGVVIEGTGSGWVYVIHRSLNCYEGVER